MNQVEPWFSIFQRQRMTAPNFDDLADLERRKVDAFVNDWNKSAHPFNWTPRSFDAWMRATRQPVLTAAAA